MHNYMTNFFGNISFATINLVERDFDSAQAQGSVTIQTILHQLKQGLVPSHIRCG